jgi:hypothetical protein
VLDAALDAVLRVRLVVVRPVLLRRLEAPFEGLRQNLSSYAYGRSLRAQRGWNIPIYLSCPLLLRLIFKLVRGVPLECLIHGLRWCIDHGCCRIRCFTLLGCSGARRLLLLSLLAEHHLLELVLVLLPEDAGPLLPFGNEVVGGGQVVEPVLLDVQLALLDVDLVVFVEQLHDLRVDGDRVLPYDDSFLLVWLRLVVPRMSPDVLDRVPASGVWIQDQLQQLFGIIAEEGWQFVFRLEDFLIKLLRILVFERQVAAHHRIEDDATRPDVCAQPEIPLPFDHLRRRIARTATSRLQSFSGVVEVAQPKVDDFDAVVVVEQKVFGLQVSVDNAQLVDVLDARYDLLVHLGCLLLFQPSIFDNVLEELSAGAILHDQVEVVIVLDHFVQLDYMRMPHFLENRDFAIDPVDVGLIFDLVFFQDLDGHLVARDNVRALLNFAECAFAFRLADDEASDLFAFAVFFFVGVLFFGCLASGLNSLFLILGILQRWLIGLLVGLGSLSGWFGCLLWAWLSIGLRTVRRSRHIPGLDGYVIVALVIVPISLLSGPLISSIHV